LVGDFLELHPLFFDFLGAEVALLAILLDPDTTAGTQDAQVAAGGLAIGLALLLSCFFLGGQAFLLGSLFLLLRHAFYPVLWALAFDGSGGRARADVHRFGILAGRLAVSEVGDTVFVGPFINGGRGGNAWCYSNSQGQDEGSGIHAFTRDG